jgi:hypothetical protein
MALARRGDASLGVFSPPVAHHLLPQGRPVSCRVRDPSRRVPGSTVVRCLMTDNVLNGEGDRPEGRHEAKSNSFGRRIYVDGLSIVLRRRAFVFSKAFRPHRPRAPRCCCQAPIGWHRVMLKIERFAAERERGDGYECWWVAGLIPKPALARALSQKMQGNLTISICFRGEGVCLTGFLLISIPVRQCMATPR